MQDKSLPTTTFGQRRMEDVIPTNLLHATSLQKYCERCHSEFPPDFPDLHFIAHCKIPVNAHAFYLMTTQAVLMR